MRRTLLPQGEGGPEGRMRESVLDVIDSLTRRSRPEVSEVSRAAVITRRLRAAKLWSHEYNRPELSHWTFPARKPESQIDAAGYCRHARPRAGRSRRIVGSPAGYPIPPGRLD